MDLANTVACPGCRGGDALASAAEANRWIPRKLSGEGLRVEASEMATLRQFRDELRNLLEAAVHHAEPSDRALAAINRAAARTPSRSALCWSRGRWVVREFWTEPTGAGRLLSLAGRSALDLLGKSPPNRVRKCEGPGCVHFLVAHRSDQRWCSPTGCGNRARVQRHYRKARPPMRGG